MGKKSFICNSICPDHNYKAVTLWYSEIVFDNIEYIVKV